MKYGEQLEHESVPQWSLHNLDYNSLKHEIKVHTTRDQAVAMAIPGQQDPALLRFEDALYLELCRQHDRVDLFVSSKADEISRRINHLEAHIQRWIDRCPDDPNAAAILKRQRRFAKYERELLQCGDDVSALSRFAKAQVVAFRKIVKKYKKWTGSTTLGVRFTDNVLSNQKSFTRRDFSALQSQYEETLHTLRGNAPDLGDPISSSSSDEPFSIPPRTERNEALEDSDNRSYPQITPPIKYWNEYDNGSETGDPEDEFAIYINPDEDIGFPGFGLFQAVLSLPFEKVKAWFRSRDSSADHRPLLSSNADPEASYNAINASPTMDSDEEGYASSDGYPTNGYTTLYAFPSISEQKVIRYREKVLLWGTIGSFVGSFVLLAIAGILITTGKHKLRVEVDAAVTASVVISLFCACSGLGMTLYRTDGLPLSQSLMVWSTFIASCILNGMLLVLVVGNAP